MLENSGVSLGPSPELEVYSHKTLARISAPLEATGFSKNTEESQGLLPAWFSHQSALMTYEYIFALPWEAGLFSGDYHFHNNCYSFHFLLILWGQVISSGDIPSLSWIPLTWLPLVLWMAPGLRLSWRYLIPCIISCLFAISWPWTLFT